MSEERRVIAITGAGGTLGAVLSRQLAGEPDGAFRVHPATFFPRQRPGVLG